MRAPFPIAASAGLLLTLAAAAAQEVAGSQDHPVLGQRFPGSVIIGHEVVEFDEDESGRALNRWVELVPR